MLTLIERTRLHLNQPYTLGWDWTAEALIEELTAKLQDAALPARLREVYTSLKLDLLLGCEDETEASYEEVDAEEVPAPAAPVDRTAVLASGHPKPVLRQQKPAVSSITDAHNYQVLEVKGFVYAVHPDYVQKFRANYNPAWGGWFGAGKDNPPHTVVPL